jgi:predicted CoA-substrate-specific enzyme activase
MNVYLGCDIGSTFTKICVLGDDGNIVSLDSFQTPAAQKSVFSEKLAALSADYHILASAACGYGRENIPVDITLPELSALGRGIFHILPEARTVLDIGGQDAKAIHCQDGKLSRFLLNDKCAAGSGLFLQNALRILDLDFVSLAVGTGHVESLSTICAVFAQTEIIRLIAKGTPQKEIIDSVLLSILKQAASLLRQIEPKPLAAFTGGLSLIPGLGDMLSSILEMPVTVPAHSNYLAAIGCAFEAARSPP